MKIKRKIVGLALILFVLTGNGYAQTNDTVVSVEAEAAGLSLVSPDAVTTGTFWLATIPDGTHGNGVMPPYPCLPPGVSGDNIYALPNGNFLVDATGNESGASPDQLAMLADSVSNLIVQTTATASRTMGVRAMDDSGPPGFNDTNDDGGGYTYTNFPSAYSFDTNLLWLEITNVSSGLAYLNAHNATNEVYAVWTTTNLLTPFTNWNVVTELWPTTGTTNVLPFTVSADNNVNLFWRAEDWTGVYANGLPCWWTWLYFGNLSETAADLDPQGNDLGDDYTNNMDPNAISFAVLATNNYVNTGSANLQLDIFAGLPVYYAVLVNDTNEADAVWQPYAGTNIMATLGADGSYDISVGLRGYAPGELAGWQDVQLTKDTVPPVITITNPVTGTVTQPMIQVQGFANEPVTGISYDLSNATGIFTNQTAYTTGQYFDTNLLTFTADYFQCYDVPVTNGLNVISIHAFDPAGNETTTNLDYTLIYSTNPPVLSLVWPLPSALIGGSNFTLQATVDDDTARVTATITDTNGDTNTVTALVERNGNVWADNLPLAAGTNFVTLTATNAAGNVNTTNFTVVQSGVSLTIDPISSDQPNQPTVTVTGTVSDPSQEVWVNGMQAGVDGDGNWVADGVPVNPYGTANLNVLTGSDTNNPTGGQTLNQAQPVTVAVSGYYSDEYIKQHNPDPALNSDNGNDYYYAISRWSYSGGGVIFEYSSSFGIDWNLGAGSATYPLPAGQAGLAGNNGFAPWSSGSGVTPINYYAEVGSRGESVQTQVAIQPSGTAVAGQTVWYLAEACALDSNGNSIPASAMRIQGQTLVDTGITNNNGAVWGATVVSAPAGVIPGTTPTFTGSYLNQLNTFTNQAFPLSLQVVDANTDINLSAQTNAVIVGQQMNFTAQLSVTNAFMTNWPLSNFQWAVPGYAQTNFYVSTDALWTNGYPIQVTATNSQGINFFWADGETNWNTASNRIVQCSAIVNGQTVTGQAVFKVWKPIVKINTTTSSVRIGTDISGEVFRMYFGEYRGTNIDAIPGIQFSNAVVMPTEAIYNYGITNFSINWIQLITTQSLSIETYGTNHILLTPTVVLDTQYPDGDIPDSFDDSPGISLEEDGETAASYTTSFKTWIMFKPDGGGWVPMRIVNWNIDCAASLSGTNWVLSKANWSTNPPDADCGTNYPVWTNNCNNTNSFTWQPPL